MPQRTGKMPRRNYRTPLSAHVVYADSRSLLTRTAFARLANTEMLKTPTQRATIRKCQWAKTQSYQPFVKAFSDINFLIGDVVNKWTGQFCRKLIIHRTTKRGARDPRRAMTTVLNANSDTRPGAQFTSRDRGGRWETPTQRPPIPKCQRAKMTRQTKMTKT